jgi:large subunit ribosomal protein L1
LSFNDQAISENIRSFIDAVSKAKPAGVKGSYIKKISISSTMGPGIKIDLSDVLDLAA